MSFKRVYLDSNILIAAFGGDSDQDLALKLMAVIGAIVPQPQAPYLTSELTLSEVLVRPMRLGLESSIFSFDNVLTTGPWLEVQPVARDILWAAANLRSQHKNLKLPDAIHIATALSTRCSHLLTADTGINGTYRVNLSHNGATYPSTPVEVIRPDGPTLQRLVDWQSA